MNSTVGMILIGIGLVFDIVGCIGLVRLPDVYTRLQASTKCVTLGTCLILFGAFLVLGFTSAGIKTLVCMVFIGVVSPTAAHALARAAHKSGIKPADGVVVDKYADDQKK